MPDRLFYERSTAKKPRLPLEGGIDLTYRCNNNCRHCWIVCPGERSGGGRELDTSEWIGIINQARALGTREWMISGGEPMIREDFAELLGYVLGRSAFCSLNTNGTLITAALAAKMKNIGIVKLSLYGATAETHDHVTRNRGSYEAAMRGISYLREAGVPFMIQLVPMRDNIHQWQEMKAVAQALSPLWRIGAAYLILSASGAEARNAEIRAQRLAPEQLIAIDPPNIPYEERGGRSSCDGRREGRTYRHCLAERDSFHIDPAGRLSFCCFVMQDRLRFNLKRGSFSEGWDSFLPSLAEETQDGLVFDNSCRECPLRADCQRCPAQSHLEHRRADRPSPYLCEYTKKKEEYRRQWKAGHRRYFRIADVTIEMNSELEFQDDTLNPALAAFAVDEPGEDVIQLEHFFSLPEWSDEMLGQLLYRHRPWMIYGKGDTWSYVGYSMQGKKRNIHQLAVFTEGYSRGRVFLNSDYRWRRGNQNSTALFPTDQVWLAQALLSRKAFYVHSCGLIVDGNGLLFVGHSRAGKSTIAKLFAGQAELLCDDRNIVRFWPGQGWRLYGSWSHGELSSVSPSSAPLKAIFFLEKSPENGILRLNDRMGIIQRLTPCLPRPYVDVKWWEGIWPLLSLVAGKIPSYVLRFDKSGAIVPLIRDLDYKVPRKCDPSPG